MLNVFGQGCFCYIAFSVSCKNSILHLIFFLRDEHNVPYNKSYKKNLSKIIFFKKK